jgi:hypothetical protein
VTNPGKILYTWNGDYALAYQVIGQGPIDLMYLPAWGSHLDWNWQIPEHARFMRKLASFSRLIVTDPRGVRASDRFPPGQVPTLEERVDDLLTVLDTVNMRRAAIFAGHEMGWVAMLAAASHPARRPIRGSAASGPTRCATFGGLTRCRSGAPGARRRPPGGRASRSRCGKARQLPATVVASAVASHRRAHTPLRDPEGLGPRGGLGLDGPSRLPSE